MVCKSFLHNDPDAFQGHEISLHDCVANHITCDNGILRFDFSDGFWITLHHHANRSGKTLRTDAAMAEFTVEDMEDISLLIFTKKGWPRSCTCVENWRMEELASAVNQGKCVLEFITQYRTCTEQMWICAIRSEKRPYYRELQLYLPKTDAVYCWNNLCSDCEW